MGRIIRVNGSEEELLPQNGTHFSLEELRRAVGGSVEVLHLPTGQIIVMDEDGKATKPENRRATLMGRVCGIAHDDYVCGDVVVCEPGELQ